MSVPMLILMLIAAVTAVMVAFFIPDVATKFLGLTVLGGIMAYLLVRLENTRRQLTELDRLRAAYDQLDEQAKLIIRTDFELHRTQEELDRRLASLMSLHKLGQQFDVTLGPEEVYSRLDPSVITSFGFAKGLLGVCGDEQTIKWCSRVGIEEAEAESVQQHFTDTQLIKHLLAHPEPHVIEASSTTEAHLQQLLKLLHAPAAVVAGIVPEAGPSGCLVLCRTHESTTDPRAEEELVAILVNQLVSAVESAALYEKAWSSTRELERKVLERTRELEALNAQLVKLSKAKSDFVSSVSHELRTPLAAIKGYASLLYSGQFGKPTKAMAERLAKIDKHSDWLTGLIDNMLDIARIESGRTAMETQVLNAKEFFANIQDLVRPQMDERHITYRADLDGVQEITGDPQHLQRVFMNLLSNAVKYTPDGGTISLHAGQERDFVLIRVQDNGRGIPAQELPKLFQEFYRASDPINQQIKGTGLGLSLVKRIVEAHHGTVEVTSEVGHGSTFLVRLPAQPKEPHHESQDHPRR